MNLERLDTTPPERRRRSPWPLWPVATTLIAASVLYCLPLFYNLGYWGRQDWDQFTFRYATPRIALLRDHVAPTWNPYAAGGNVMLAHPDSPVLSPWYLIVLVFDAPLGLRLQVLIFMALGAVGMAVLSRHLGAQPLGAIAGGVVFMMSSHFALHITEGHLEWCVLGLMPWVALALLRDGRRSAIVAALLLASVLLFGSVYVPAIFVPFFSMWMLFEAVRHRRLNILTRWMAIVCVTALLASPKLIPMAVFASSHPRAPELESRTPLSLLVTMFGDPRQARFYQAKRDEWLPDGHFAKVLSTEQAAPLLTKFNATQPRFKFHEYGCYIGLAGILLAVVGAVRAGRRHWPLCAAGGVAAVAMLGASSPIDLWDGLLHLPFYRQLRVPSRFLMAVVFVLAVAAALGMSVLLQMLRGRLAPRRQIVGVAVLALLYGELLTMGWTLFGDIFVAPPVPLERQDTFSHRCDNSMRLYVEVLDTNMYRCLLANAGDLDAFEALTVERGAVLRQGAPGYRGEVYLESGHGTAEFITWTMSHVSIRVAPTAPDRLFLNQNFNSGWRGRLIDADGVVTSVRPVDIGGLVSVPVGERTTRVELWYEAEGLTTGLIVSGATLAWCLVGLRKSRDEPVVAVSHRGP